MPGLNPPIIQTNMPGVFIDKVYIRSDVNGIVSPATTQDGLSIDVSIYLSADDGVEPTDYIEQISSYFGYAAIIFDNSKSNSIISGQASVQQHMKKYKNWFIPGYGTIGLDDALFVGSTDITTETVSDEESIDESTSTLEVVEANYYVHTMQEGTTITETTRQGVYLNTNYVMFNFSDFFEVDESGVAYSEYLEDAYESPTYKYTTTINLPLELVYSDFTFNTLYQFLSGIGNEDFSNLYLFSFSSILDLDSEIELNSAVIQNDIYGDMFFSQIAYELIFENNGQLATGPLTKWKYPSGDIYEGTGMQTIIGTYHAASYDERSITYGQFLDLIESQRSTSQSDEFNEILDSLEGLVVSEISEPTLLVELNNFLLVYPEKGTDTQIGIFYDTLNALVQNEIINYGQNPQLEKTLLFNSKLIDSRIVEDDTSYEFPEPVPNTADATAGETASNRIYDDPPITRYAYHKEYYGMDHTTIWEASDTLFTTGYIFADIEKIIRNDTALSSIIDIDKLELFFGQEITSKAIKIDSHYLTRFYDEDAQFYILTRYADQYSEAEAESEGIEDEDRTTDYIVAASPMEIVPIATVSTSLQGSPVYYEIDVGVDGVPDNTYCLLRNFEATTETRSGYRLACFEFQDYYDILLADESDAIDQSLEHYTFYLTCEDKSLEVLYGLRDLYYEELTKFEEYYNLANEFCSYNNIKGYFNQFFINSINTFYENDSTNFPYRRAPYVYNMFQEILYNFFDGDLDRLNNETASLEKQITPEEGTMDQIESFYNSMLSLYTNFLDVDGTIGQQITAAESGEFDLSYYNEFRDLPPIIDMGESYEDYGEDLAPGLAAAAAEEELEYYTNLYETTMTLYNTNLKEYVDEKIQEYDDLGLGNKLEKADIIRDIKKYIGEIKDNAKDYADTINGLLETAGATTTSAGDYNHFPTYTSAFKDVYAANTTMAFIAYSAILDKDSDIEDEAESSEATSEIGEPHDLNALRLFRYGF
tara:strand:+ start:6239 stop:9211 length:2973 start_codon:yes stop_codon:yes gene_type:complete